MTGLYEKEKIFHGVNTSWPTSVAITVHFVCLFLCLHVHVNNKG